MSVVLVSDTSVLVDMHHGSVLDIALRLPYAFAVPDLLFNRELRTWDGPSLEVNDPFELFALNCMKRERRRTLHAFRHSQDGKIGLLSFGQSWKSPVLWSHYAAGHKGICLGPDRASGAADVSALRVFACMLRGLDQMNEQWRKVSPFRRAHGRRDGSEGWVWNNATTRRPARLVDGLGPPVVFTARRGADLNDARSRRKQRNTSFDKPIVGDAHRVPVRASIEPSGVSRAMRDEWAARPRAASFNDARTRSKKSGAKELLRTMAR